MVSAIILINTELPLTDQAAKELADIEGISEVYSVGGRYDLVAIIRVYDNDSLADLVTHRVAHVKGITQTESLIAYRTYSPHDLERMFSIGMEGN